jgi:hypothetical protein
MGRRELAGGDKAAAAGGDCNGELLDEATAPNIRSLALNSYQPRSVLAVGWVLAILQGKQLHS